MTKLEELIKELCPNGVEHVELKEIGPVCMCKRILKSQTTSNGEVPFIKLVHLAVGQILLYRMNFMKSIRVNITSQIKGIF